MIPVMQLTDNVKVRNVFLLFLLYIYIQHILCIPVCSLSIVFMGLVAWFKITDDDEMMINEFLNFVVLAKIDGYLLACLRLLVIVGTVCPTPVCNPDLWPFDLETGVRVTSKVGNLHSKFWHARPSGSRIIRYVCDGQTDRQMQTKATLIAPFPTIGQHNRLHIRLKKPAEYH